MIKNILSILLIISTSAVAQRLELLSGSLKVLKGQTSYNIKFNYDNMIVGAGMAEKDYLADLRARWEAREPDKGNYFVTLWFDARKEFYEPLFVRNFEKYAKVKLHDTTAKYTLLVKTKHTEGGWNLGIARQPGEIDGELYIVESLDPDKVIATISFYKIMGKVYQGGDFEMTTRIQSAYAIAGKGLGYFLKRKSK